MHQQVRDTYTASGGAKGSLLMQMLLKVVHQNGNCAIRYKPGGVC